MLVWRPMSHITESPLPGYLHEEILLHPEKREFPPFDLVRLLGTVFAAVHHSEVIAERIGEPYGTLLLTLGLATAVAARVQLGKNWSDLESATVLPGQRLVAAGLYRPVAPRYQLGWAPPAAMMASANK